MPEKTREVTKREAATCQLETAIKLFLEDRDLISAYTLCCASDGILEGMYKNEREEILRRQQEQSVAPGGLRFSWAEELEIRIKPEHQKQVFRLLNAPQNFFKHADRDHDTSYQFPDWELTGLRTLTTVMNYYIVFREITPAMTMFFTLYAVFKPELMADENSLSGALAAMPDLKKMSGGRSREDMAALGYSALKLTCPRLFKRPRTVGGIF